MIFFEKLNNDYTDECEIEIKPVLFTDETVELVNTLKWQWYTMVYGDQTSIPRIT